MVFEQEFIGDAEYFHQDRNGWKEWCDKNSVRLFAQLQKRGCPGPPSVKKVL